MIKNRYFKLLVQAVLAGICIGLGGTVFLRVKDAFAGGTVVGAVFFSIGLFVICTRGYALFTGKACYLFDNSPAYLLDLLLIWAGNLLGTLLLALAERCTVIASGSGIDAAAAAMAEAKLASPLLSLFFLGMICNIFIFIAVNGYAKNPHELGKYMALVFGVTCFILCGTEHSVADMYYFCVSGVLFAKPLQTLGALAVISLGNVCGGVLLPLGEKLLAEKGAK